MNSMNRINLIGPAERNLGRLFDPSFKFEHTCVLTFTVDLLLYEQTLLRHFLASGSSNNILIADRRHLLKAFNSQYRFLTRDSSAYVFHGANTGHIFHPKSLIFVSGDEIRVFFGSGNLTTSGLSSNQELFHELSTKNEDHRVAISEYLAYLTLLVEHENGDSTFTDRINRMLVAASSVMKLQNVAASSNLHFIHNLTEPLMDQVKAYVPLCQKMSIISPFFDRDFKSIHHMQRTISSDISVYFQPTYTDFNGDAYRQEFPIFKHTLDVRSLHAKLYVFEQQEDCTLFYGSPNCSYPALYSNAASGNSEIALIQTHVAKKNIDYYIPSEKISISLDQIVPMRISDMESIQFLIRSATFTRDGIIKIELSQQIETTDNISVNVNGKVISDAELSYDIDKKHISFPYVSSENILYWLSITHKGIVSNVVLVLNQQKEVARYDANETRLMNRLSKYLEIDSMGLIALSRSLDPFVDVQSVIENDSSQMSDANVEDEKEAEESEVMLQTRDFYVHVKDIHWDMSESINAAPYRSYVFDLFDTVSKFYKLIKDKDEPSGNSLEIDATVSSLRTVRQFDQFDSYVKKVFSHIEELAIAFDSTKNLPMNISLFRNYYRDIVSYIPHATQLMFGVKVRQSFEDIYYISWSHEQSRKVVPLLIKIIAAFWRNALFHRTYLLDKIPKDYFVQFFILSLKNLLLLDAIERNIPQKTMMILNRGSIDYIFSQSIGILSQVVTSFEILANSIDNKGESFDKLYEHIIQKYSLDLDMSKNTAVFLSQLHRIGSQPNIQKLMTDFIMLRQKHIHLGISEAISQLGVS